MKSDLWVEMRQPARYGVIDVFLYENLLEDAMAAIDRSPYSADLERVIKATRAEFPDWGIAHCKRQAESIMDAGKAGHYDQAVSWLKIARDIYDEHDRLAEWRVYLAGLLGLHARKYKLVPMLKAIR